MLLSGRNNFYKLQECFVYKEVQRVKEVLRLLIKHFFYYVQGSKNKSTKIV